MVIFLQKLSRKKRPLFGFLCFQCYSQFLRIFTLGEPYVAEKNQGYNLWKQRKKRKKRKKFNLPERSEATGKKNNNHMRAMQSQIYEYCCDEMCENKVYWVTCVEFFLPYKMYSAMCMQYACINTGKPEIRHLKYECVRMWARALQLPHR